MSDGGALNGFRPRAVIFDLDGLLLDTERLTRMAMQEEAVARGLVFEEGLFLRMVGVDETGTRRAMAENFGADFPYDEFRVGYRGRVRDRIASAGIPMRPFALETVMAVKAAGLPRAVCTSSWIAQAEPHLKQAHIWPLLDALVTRDDVTNAKPNPEPYLLAASRLGIAPEDCLALEDSHSGVQAASAAGIRVVMVPDLLPVTDEMRGLATAIAADLGEVRGWLGL